MIYPRLLFMALKKGFMMGYGTTSEWTNIILKYLKYQRNKILSKQERNDSGNYWKSVYKTNTDLCRQLLLQVETRPRANVTHLTFIIHLVIGAHQVIFHNQSVYQTHTFFKKYNNMHYYRIPKLTKKILTEEIREPEKQLTLYPIK